MAPKNTEAPRHTPGPWTFERNGKSDSGREPNGIPYAWINLDCPGRLGGIRLSGHSAMADDEMAANAARIVACVHELEGLTFDPGAIGEVVEALRKIKQAPSHHGAYSAAELLAECCKAAADALARLTREVA